MADLRFPPGRAGRLWLAGRLRTARRAGVLLDRKLHILRTEQERFALLAQRTGADWAETRRVAAQWLARAAILGGQREIRLATIGEPIDVTIEWNAVMGVRYPMNAAYQAAESPTGTRGLGSAALIEARTAYQVALRAAVAHAAAMAARRTVDREAAATRQRLRSITDRWIPRLENALRELTERLEEAERAETVRLHWAATRSDSTGGRR